MLLETPQEVIGGGGRRAILGGAGGTDGGFRATKCQDKVGSGAALLMGIQPIKYITSHSSISRHYYDTMFYNGRR